MARGDVAVVRRTRREKSAPIGAKDAQMSLTTLLIILLLIAVLGGGGYYGRGRWY